MRQILRPNEPVDFVTSEEMATMFRGAREVVRLGLGGADIEHVFDDIPVKGTRTQVTSWDRGDGGDQLVIPAATFTDIVSDRAGRIAGSIVNVGANPVYIYLAKAGTVAQMGFGKVTNIYVGYLTPNGNFDFKLSNDVWCGPVCAYSVAGTTLAWGVH